MVFKKKKTANNNKQKSTFSKFVWTSGEKYKFFVWDQNIQRMFMTLLIISVILLSILTYTQNIYIKQLQYKSNYLQNENITPLVIPLEDFISENGLEGSAISHMAEYFQAQGFKLDISVGFLQASKKECDGKKCLETVYRFNQKKGKYLDKFIIETRKN